MNNFKIRSQGGHSRIQFSPLSISCTLRCMTPDSPIAQNVNANISPWEYEPDRKLTPTLILPDIRVKDPDKIFPAGTANANLSIDSIDWRVNGKPIAEVWSADDYEIVKADDDTRGMLKVKRNMQVGETAVLTFSGKVYDWRTGAVLNAVSDQMPLLCTETGENKLTLCLDKRSMEYDPVYDDLTLYETMVAEGLADEGHRNAYINAKCYEMEVGIKVGDIDGTMDALPKGYEVKLYEVGGSQPVSPNSVENPEVTSFDSHSLKLDLRLIDKKEYEVRLVRSDKVIDSDTLTVHRKVTMPTLAKPRYENDINVRQTVYDNEALVVVRDRIAPFPTLFYLLQWFTMAQRFDSLNNKYVDAEPVPWQQGNKMRCAIEEIGIGHKLENSSFLPYFELEARGCCELIADENGDVIVDENGEFIID